MVDLALPDHGFHRFTAVQFHRDILAGVQGLLSGWGGVAGQEDVAGVVLNRRVGPYRSQEDDVIRYIPCLFLQFRWASPGPTVFGVTRPPGISRVTRLSQSGTAAP